MIGAHKPGITVPVAFKTSFGDRIPLDPSYGERFGKFVRRDRPTELYGETYRQSALPLGIGAFAYKHYEACWIFDALRQAGIALKFDSMLDLGSGFAAMPRITFVRGYAREVTAIDLFPYGVSALTNGRARVMLAAVSLAQRLGLKNLRGPMGKWDLIASKENFKLPLIAGGAKFQYVVGDIYEHAGRYDWINSSLTLTHFDHRKLFPKISALLVEGGVFTFTVECWWYPVNSTQIVGLAPYICQRLTRDDLLRYYREVHPEIAVDKIAEVYDYYAYPSHPTASTYIETAAAHDLHPIFVHRHMNPGSFNKRSAVPPAHLGRETGETPLDALANIRRIRQDVVLEDLYTSHYLLGFRKVSRRQ